MQIGTAREMWTSGTANIRAALPVFEILRGEGESWHIRHSPLLTPRTLLEQIDGVQIDFLCRSSIFFPLAAPDVPSSPRCTRSGVPSSSSSFLFNQIRSLEEDGENSHFFPSRHLGRSYNHSYNHLGIGNDAEPRSSSTHHRLDHNARSSLKGRRRDSGR